MAQQEYPTLNEVAPSWSDLSLSFPIYGGKTVKLTDIAAVKWSRSVEVGTVRGTSGGRVLRRTTGQIDYEASITFYRSGWDQLQDALAEMDARVSLVGFDVLIQHTPPGSSKIYNVVIQGCRVLGDSGDMSEGVDADKIEVNLSPMLVLVNGRQLL